MHWVLESAKPIELLLRDLFYGFCLAVRLVGRMESHGWYVKRTWPVICKAVRTGLARVMIKSCFNDRLETGE